MQSGDRNPVAVIVATIAIDVAIRTHTIPVGSAPSHTSWTASDDRPRWIRLPGAGERSVSELGSHDEPVHDLGDTRGVPRGVDCFASGRVGVDRSVEVDGRAVVRDHDP